jgi:hypothetical protein
MHDLSDVASLVEIQPEATVSRTVLQAEGARVVLFSFDAGQVLTEHTAAVPALLQVLDGHLRITADGRTVDLPLVARVDTVDEIGYFKSGGILQHVLRNLAAA